MLSSRYDSPGASVSSGVGVDFGLGYTNFHYDSLSSVNDELSNGFWLLTG